MNIIHHTFQRFRLKISTQRPNILEKNSVPKLHLKSFENPGQWEIVQKSVRKIQLKSFANPRRMDHSAKQCTETPAQIICKTF